MKKSITLLLIFCAGVGVFAQNYDHKILIEHFTQASCTPCAIINPGFNAIIDNNEEDIVAIKFQTQFPGFDPMFFQAPELITARDNYNDVSFVPSVYINGGLSYAGNPGQLNEFNVQTIIRDFSPQVQLDLSHTISPDGDSVYVDVQIINQSVSTISGDNVLHVMLLEREIAFPCGPPGSNGEEEFFDVARLGITGNFGDPITDIAPGETVRRQYAAEIPSFIYDKRQLKVAAFYQNNSTKLVYNANKTEPQTLNEFKDVALDVRGPFLDRLCSENAASQLVVDNVGNTDITSLSVVLFSSDLSVIDTIEVELDTLAVGESATQDFTLSGLDGTASVSARVIDINGNPSDDYSFNNVPCGGLFVKQISAPEAPRTIETSFEDDPAEVAPGIAIVENPTDEWIWTVINAEAIGSTTPASNGSQSVVVDFFNWPTDSVPQEVSMVLLNRLDLSDVFDATLTFDYYKSTRRTNPSYQDSVAFEYSLDCGDTWNTIWKSGGEALQTVRRGEDEVHYPTSIRNWEEEFTLELSVFDSLDGEAILRFRAINGGNNLFAIDNIIFTNKTSLADNDEDGYLEDEDCDDNNPEINPGAEESCNDIDDNCNNEIDEGLETRLYYYDADGDGFGSPDSTIMDCDVPEGFDNDSLDCNDNDPDINPRAEEINNNGIDEDCDGIDGSSSVDELSSYQINFFPNPVRDQLYIENLPEQAQIDIFNLLGQKVDSRIAGLQTNIDVQNLTKGTYILRITETNTGKRKISTIVIQ